VQKKRRNTRITTIKKITDNADKIQHMGPGKIILADWVCMWPVRVLEENKKETKINKFDCIAFKQSPKNYYGTMC